MASSVEVSVETLQESQIEEVKLDGIEVYRAYVYSNIFCNVL